MFRANNQQSIPKDVPIADAAPSSAESLGELLLFLCRRWEELEDWHHRSQLAPDRSAYPELDSIHGVLKNDCFLSEMIMMMVQNGKYGIVQYSIQ